MDCTASPRNVYVIGGFRVEDFANNEFYECDFANNEFYECDFANNEFFLWMWFLQKKSLNILHTIRISFMFLHVSVKMLQYYLLLYVLIKPWMVFADFTNVI